MRRFLFLFLFSPLLIFAQNKNQAILKGKITNKLSGEPVSGCVILVSPGGQTFYSNDDGSYKINLSQGEYSLNFRHLAFVKITQIINVTKNSGEQLLNVELAPATIENKGVTITAAKEYPGIVLQQLENKDLEKMPNIYSDVIRSVQILAGVSSNNELTSSYNVRGGSSDENLIYLNGYEIYRPLLLREGVEENQSIINPDMVGSLKFSNGAFSALYGDKMSSALDVEYLKDTSAKIITNVRADLMSAGVSARTGFDNGSIIVGGRYAYPTLFLGGLQTKGSYNPSFSDFQLFANYSPAEKHNIELFSVINSNKYDVTPENWLGNYGFAKVVNGYLVKDYGAVKIDYLGKKYYSYNTALTGLKYTFNIVPALTYFLSYSYFGTSEKEDGDIISKIYSYADAKNMDEADTVKNRYDNKHNKINLYSHQIKTGFNYVVNNHTIDAGTEIKYVTLKENVNEYFREEGQYALQITPAVTLKENSFNLNSFAVYANDYIKFSPLITVELGARYLANSFTNEKLFSPRGGVFYHYNATNIFSFNCGVYYQPPFFNELTGQGIDVSELKSQKSTHYVLGWEWTGNKKISFQAQAYYKNLSRLIPFYYDEMKMIYSKGNVNEGYAYGLDLMVKGEIVKGIDSWIGYGYIDSKEHLANSNEPYKRRLYDQTHTLQVFFQDRIPNHPEWQSHFRLLAGSGFLYYNRKITTDPITGNYQLTVDYNNPDEFLFYMRADMGLSYEHLYKNNMKIVVMFEILNVFDKQNFAGYDFMLLFPTTKNVVYIPQALSERFFNIKMNLTI